MDIKEALNIINNFSTELSKSFRKDSSNTKDLYKNLTSIGVYNKTSKKLKEATKIVLDEYEKLSNKPPVILTLYRIPYTPLFCKTQYFETEYEFTITDIPCVYCGSKFLVQDPTIDIPNAYYCPNCRKDIILN